MNWYYAKDGQQLGPVDETQLAALISSGVIRGSTLVWREGMGQWQPYEQVWTAGMPDWRGGSSVPPSVGSGQPSTPAGGASCSVCQNVFPPDELIAIEGQKVCAVCKPSLLQRLKEGLPGSSSSGGFQELDPDSLVRLAADRQNTVEPMAILSSAWQLFKAQPGLLLGTFVVVNLCIMAGAMVPFLGSCIGLFINGPLMAGLWSVYIRAVRGEQVAIGDAFCGFSKRFWPLVGTNILVSILASLALIPALIAFGVIIFTNQGRPPEGAQLILPISLLVLALPVVIYLTIAWIFALPLVVDRGYGVWDAMNTSRRIVGRRFIPLILLGLLSLALTFAGMLALCVGLLVTVPVSMAMFATAYEELCGSKVRAN